jgi:parvulin-like peptidyl-prolyl isomerase
MRRFSLTLPVLLALSACGKPDKTHPAGPGITDKAKEATVEQVPKAQINADDSQLTAQQRAIVVAKIGDHTITLGEIEARLAREPAVIRSQFGSVQKRKEYLTSLVQFELLSAEAARRGLANDPEVLEAAKQAMIRKFLADAAVEAVKPEQFTDADLQTYYDANLGLFHKPAQVDLSHILLKDQATAERIAKELRAASEGASAKLVVAWNDYVGRYSQDEATVPYLGSLGLVSKTPPQGATPQELERLARVPAELIDAAMPRELFTIGSPVQSPQGWHVLMVTSRVPAVDKPFDEVKESIRTRLVKRERDLRRQKLVDELRAGTKVELNEDALTQLPVPAPPPKKGDLPAGVSTTKQPADPTPSEP